MAIADVLAKTDFTGFSTAEENTIKAAITTGYNGSATAKAMFDNWIATAGNRIDIKEVAGAFQAYRNTGRVEIDLGFLTNASYVDNKGNAVEDTLVTALLHELVHALLDKSDNWDRSLVGDYRGDTVVESNKMYKELGLTEQNSYIAYDSTGNVLTRGTAYTNGASIDRSISGDSNLSSAPAGNSKDLIVGGASANNLQTGGGNDFLFGGGGNDNLNGGAGTDTGVLSGKPVDYDVRLNADGATWSAKHVRGAKDEGNDTFTNLERVMFEGGETYNLTKGGLTYQTDFAFVVDATGSMGDDIAAVKSAATGVINALFGAGTIDARIGVVTFRDTTIGQPTLVPLQFTDQDLFADRQTAALNAINGLGASGGGDFPESAFDGLLKALDGSMGDWRLGAGTKRIALFTDASAKDLALLPTVAALAASLGVSVAGSASDALGDFGRVDTFTFAPGDGPEGRDLISHGDDPVDYLPDDAPATPVGGLASVQISTIFIDTFIDPDPSLVEVSEGSGGSVLIAEDAEEVVERLLEVIETANYTITANTATVTEGTDASLSFTLARDRGDDAATVTLGTVGDADDSDVDVPSLTVEFAEGELVKQIEVGLLDDGSLELDETFGLEILNVTGDSTVSVAQATTTIVDNDDEIRGTHGRDTLLGTEHDDLMRGLRGNDIIRGEDGDDTILGGGGRDRLVGRGGDDTLNGGFGNDRVLGNSGRDEITGGHGNDLLIGGWGADNFCFAEGHGIDIIADFDVGVDKITIKGDGVGFDDLEVDNVLGTALVRYLDSSVLLYGVSIWELSESDFMFDTPV